MYLWISGFLEQALVPASAFRLMYGETISLVFLLNCSILFKEPGHLADSGGKWWAQQDLNLRPTGYEPVALPTELCALRHLKLTI